MQHSEETAYSHYIKITQEEVERAGLITEQLLKMNCKL